MDMLIMENGKTMQKVDGESMKIKMQDIGMQVNGRKIENGVMGGKKL